MWTSPDLELVCVAGATQRDEPHLNLQRRDEFVPSERFAGAREGYTFTWTQQLGTGYHRDDILAGVFVMSAVHAAAISSVALECWSQAMLLDQMHGPALILVYRNL